jgi:hypothetical protein
VSDEFNDGAYYAHSSYAIYHFVIQAGQRTMSIWTSQKRDVQTALADQ